MGFGGGEVAANEAEGWLEKVEFREKGREGGKSARWINQYADRRLY